MWRGPLYSSDPASVGGQGQQHQWTIWWGDETLSKEKLRRSHINPVWVNDAVTFGARVPQSDVSIRAPWGQTSTQRRIGNTIKHFSACLWKKKQTAVQIKSKSWNSEKIKSTKVFWRPHLGPLQVLRWVFLTSVVFIAPVSTSHKRIVWSQDALQTSSLSHQRTEDTASLCPDKVMRGVWISVRE